MEKIVFNELLIREKLSSLYYEGIHKYEDIVKSLIHRYGIPPSHIIEAKSIIKDFCDWLEMPRERSNSKPKKDFDYSYEAHFIDLEKPITNRDRLSHLYCVNFSWVGKHEITYGMTICDKNRLHYQAYCKKRKTFLDRDWVNYTNLRLDMGYEEDTSISDRLGNLDPVPCRVIRTKGTKIWYGIKVIDPKIYYRPKCRMLLLNKEPGISQRKIFLKSLIENDFDFYSLAIKREEEIFENILEDN